ncbi:LpqB family beta-propeller domain-containing protein [Leucobacter insecticola]|uniref:LpqB family beta-propeller domain-containing protein n=1 Tax=Leucobacter insecticola TaxID=2714934 RepID=UPI001FCCA44B|nr:LpqB family beta-propeller domain-containing protein [Leucobacter insecticola]
MKRFELLVNGASIRESSTSSPGELRPPVDTATPAVVAERSLGVMVGGEFRELEGLSAQVLALDPDAVVLSPDSSAAAVRNSAGVSRVTPSESVLVDARAGLLEPSFDYFGNIWSAEAGAADQIHVSTPDGSELRVAAQWLKGRSPVAVRLSPDGTQIAALVPSGEGSAVLVAGVVRDESGIPLRTSDEATPQMWTTGAPVDFDWVDQLRFVALTKLGAASKVTIGAPGVFAADQGTVPGGIKVSGGGSRSLLRVLGEGDDIFAAQGSGWQRTDTEVELLTKRG